IEHRSMTFRSDWEYRGGKMDVGKSKMVESRVYSVRTTPDMHPTWREALSPDETAVRVEVHEKEALIPESHVAGAFRSTGLGRRRYMHAIDEQLAEGRIINADVTMSVNAMAMWKSLRNHGYDVVQRVPDSLLEETEGQWGHVDADQMLSIFYVA